MPKKSSSNTTNKPRKFGNYLVGDIPWGTHLCQFYESKQDLLDILVPYFSEGLHSNEFCMWVTSPPFEVEEAKQALAKAIPNLDVYLQKDQFEVISYDNWYLQDGKFDSDRVLNGWVKKEENALKIGFEGLRLTGNTFWVERNLWKNFVDYEKAINTVIGKHKMLALCTYYLPNCSGTDVIDVIRNHAGTLVKQGQKWVLMEDIVRRREVEKNLSHSEALLSSFFDSQGVMQGIVEVINDADIRHLKDNKATASYIGLEPEDLKDKLGSELGEPLERVKVWLKHYKESQNSREPVTFEYIDSQLGKDSWLSATVTYLGTQKDGNPTFSYVVNDITNRKKAEEELKESEERFSKAFNSNPHPMLIQRVNDTIFVDANEAYLQLFGFKKHEIIGHTAAELGIVTDPKVRAEIIGKASQHKIATNEWTYKTRGEEYRRLLISTVTITFKGEEHFLSILTDITERKKAEDEIARLASFPMLNPNPIFEMDFEGNITYANPAAKTFDNFGSLGIAHPLLSNWQDVVKAFESKASSTFSREVKIGNQWYSQQFFLVPNSRCIRIYSMDITERKKAEETLKQRTSQLEETQKKLEENAVQLEEYASQMESLAMQRLEQLKDAERLAAIGATAGMVGHDIRNPLQSIIGDLYLVETELVDLQDCKQKESILESVKAIEHSIDYVNKIVQDLQDYAKPIRPILKETQIEELINLILSKHDFPSTIKVETKVQKEASKIVIDPDLFRRIISNLISNSVQAMPNGGKITINVSMDKENVAITVTDSGSGIPEEAKSKLFTPLFTTKSRGQGFGLAVVKRMTEALGGTVSFESETGKGTKFIVHIPRHKVVP